MINVVELNSGFQSSGKSILSANAEEFGNNEFEIVDEIEGVSNKAYDFVILDLPSMIDDSSASKIALPVFADIRQTDRFVLRGLTIRSSLVLAAGCFVEQFEV